MQFSDYSPSRSPSLDKQRDALQKGLGRAVLWAEAGCLAYKPLLDACLTDQRYDMQAEDARTDWLWQMVEMVDAKDRFRVPILHTLHELSDERSAFQICGLGYHYARSGDKSFRKRLYEIVESKPVADSPMLGESEVIRLDREKAFSFVARIRGECLAEQEWDWHDEIFIEEAIEVLGESNVINLLSRTNDEAIKRFWVNWKQETTQEARRKAEQKHIPAKNGRMLAISVSDILSEASKEKPSIGLFRGWGMRAANHDLNTVLEKLWASVSPVETACLLRVFSNRPLPDFDQRLIELCDHEFEEVRRWAFNALSENSDPAIRRFALQRLDLGDHRAIGLLVKNYELGDEHTILNGMELPSDHFDLHTILLDVIKVLENNDVANVSQLGVVVYALTPCEVCRLYAGRLLQKHDVIPDWLSEECRFDSGDDCQKRGEDINSSVEEQET